MALDTGKRRVQPHVDDLKRQHLARHGRAEGHHVGVVVLAGESCGHGVIEQRAADAFDLVGRDGHADAGRAADDAAVTFAAGDSLRRRAREVGIVTAVLGVAAEVLIGKAALIQMLHNGVLEVKRAVVTCESDHRGVPPAVFSLLYRRRRGLQAESMQSVSPPAYGVCFSAVPSGSFVQPSRR